jgi:hypothetical protein
MRPNLSLSNIAQTLAALGGAAVVAACGAGAEVAAPAQEVTPPAAGAKAGCSASGNCGAKTKEEGAAVVPGGAASTSTIVTTPTTPAAGAAGPAIGAPEPTAEPKKDDAKRSEPAKGAAAKPPKVVKPSPGAGAGQASCGAGTCASDVKKK